MQQLTANEFEKERDRYDQAVLMSPDIDHFCSSSTWINAARMAFHAECHPLIFRLESGYLSLIVLPETPIGRLAVPLEATWGMSAPLVGQFPSEVVTEAVAALETVSDRFDSLYLMGFDKEGPWFNALVNALRPTHKLGFGAQAGRIWASLLDGEEGWLNRRGVGFKKSLRNLSNRCDQAEVQFEYHRSTSNLNDTISRIISIEHCSWKGRTGSGINQGQMLQFYQAMFKQLQEEDRLRVGFATINGDDVAFIFGGIFATTYRGLQMSYKTGFERLGLGHFMQRNQIHALCCEPIERYDLGQEMDYKLDWGENVQRSTALIAIPHSASKSPS